MDTWIHHDCLPADSGAFPSDARMQHLFLEDKPMPSIVAIDDSIAISLSVPDGIGRTTTLRIWLNGEILHTYSEEDIYIVFDAMSLANGYPGTICLAILINEFVDSFKPMVSDAVEILDVCESHIILHENEEAWNKLRVARRFLSESRRQMMQKNILESIVNSVVMKDSYARLKSCTIRLHRMANDLEFLTERSDRLIDEVHQWRDNQANTRLNHITIIGVIFMPLNMITGLAGMNVHGIPFADSPNGFWWFVAVMLMIAMFQVMIIKKLKLFK